MYRINGKRLHVARQQRSIGWTGQLSGIPAAGVIGIGRRGAGNFPGLVPGHDVHQTKRMSSAMAIAGCVSFNCMAALSERFSTLPYWFTCLRMRSCSEAEVKKYSWRRRSSCPAGVESDG
jgi:hypothetical protein